MDLTRLATSICETAEALSSQPTIDLQERVELLRACEKLSAIIEHPNSRLEKATVAISPIVAARVAINLGIFDFVHNSGKEEFTSDEIASHTGGDPLLICRILRSLTASGIFNVTLGGTYSPGPMVKDLAPGGYLASRIIMNLSPENAYAGPFQYVFDTNEHYFNWMKSRPSQMDAFNRTMQAGVERDNSARWTQIFPVEQRFQRFLSTSSPVDEELQLVDVGGGIGHEIRILLDTLPSLQGHFTLQDVPGVIQSMLPELQITVPATQTVKAMPYDFFEPQPVTRAHVYFLGRVLHDWPDAQARSILQHIRNAMGKDSVLLIHDRVLPDDAAKVHLSDTIMDFNMMALCSSLERTEAQFRELLGSVGLDLVRVWRPETAGLHRQAVLEAVRADSVNDK
ncbi:uncharacterized protein N7479_011516 [Penicillium vulpinum]|uniref:uncharacterized protein n=1 Tax=Penicillium vulpinum TaxID=29845 RepID=UPI0025476A01|nr:uncharacterized protein N7479_011516 [Penicillium vulpinum]KAJ5953103.1 hypothetical protein N7479_011516 [Penicillium vulpinum]